MNTASTLTIITGITGGTLSAYVSHPYVALICVCLLALVALAPTVRLARRDRMDNETMQRIIDKASDGACDLEQLAKVLRSRDKSPP
ncbi:MAG: hypothetical protein V9F00_04715 [Nocardioides sp.]